MTDSEWRPDGAQLTTGYLTVTKTADAIDFYEKAFGLELGERMEGPTGELAHASMKYMGTHVVMFGPEDLPWVETKPPVSSGTKSPVGLYLYNPDVDAMLKQAVEAGGKVVKEPTDMFWGDRIAVVADPFGYEWTLATKVGEFDPEKAKEQAGSM